jgi:zinc transporter, ZIP family
MIHFVEDLNPILQALLGTCFTWFMVAVGATVVFTARNPSKRMFDTALGFAAGVMIAASFWSLLGPAIELSEGKGYPAWFPPLVGFGLGVLFLRLVDIILPHLHAGYTEGAAEGIKTSWERTTLLVLAIVLHHIPEGLAVGIAFGAAAAGFPAATLAAAIALTLGIGLQNLPEGMAVAMPLRREGFSRWESFWYGQLSGMVEPIVGVIGAAAVVISKPIMPYAMGFAAGAMIFVVVEELIPESQRGGHSEWATLGVTVGFALMMVLDVGIK